MLSAALTVVRRRLAAAAVMVSLAVGVGVGAGGARADHILGPDPVVEGDAMAFDVQDNGDGTRQIEWSCRALTTEAPVASTGVTCEVWQNGRKLDAKGIASYVNAAALPPRTLTVPNGSYKICWMARAFTFHGEIVYDVTLPNCKTF